MGCLGSQPARKQIDARWLQVCSTSYTRGVVARMDDFINAVLQPKNTEAIIARL